MNLFHTPPDRNLHFGLFPAPRLERVAIDGAPEWLHGTKLLFVSDVHLRRFVSDERLEALIDQLVATKADMLLLGGDYAESRRDCLRFFHALRRASFPLGIYAVPGNNDIRNLDELREGAAAAGVTLLINESRRVRLPGGEMEIGGCDDHKYGAPRTAGLFRNDGAYRVLLSHFPSPPDCECELMLSGHTHAGQLNLFGITPYSIGCERRFHLMAVRGLHRIGDMRLFVGNGIGVSEFPLRVGAEARITLVEFGSK